MSFESCVYGYIKFDRRFDNSQTHNQHCLSALPQFSEDVLLWQGMFHLALRHDSNSCMIHFAATYDGVEYEWERWVSQFQSMLASMHWDHATVHLETAHSGSHVFSWEYEDIADSDGGFTGNIRCEWTRESAFS